MTRLPTCNQWQKVLSCRQPEQIVKQRFLNFALNHPSDLVSVSDIWVEYDTVADEWKPVFPDNIDSTDTPEVVERKMLDFETKMESGAAIPDRYKHGKDTVNILTVLWKARI